MNATRGNLLSDILGKPQQLQIPIYQRQYSWGKEQCKQLWDDILSAGKEGHDHFMGFVVYKKNKIHTLIPPITIIDGQQRLTTITLILVALADRIDSGELNVNRNQIRNTYLINSNEKDEQYKHKLILSEEDRESLKAIVDNEKHELSPRIKDNFEFLQGEINSLKDEYDSLWGGLLRLSVIEMELGENDNPQRIFETMNSTGLDLKESDKIRNYILMEMGPDEQKQLYDKYWRPMEKMFGSDNYQQYFDDFLGRYLTMHMKNRSKGVKKDDIYTTFRTFHKNMKDKYDILSDMHKFADYYVRIVLPGREDDRELGRAFENLRNLRAEISYPLLMYLYREYDEYQKLRKSEFIETVMMIESYVFRRSVCGFSSSYNGSAMLCMLKEYRAGGMAMMKKKLGEWRGDLLFPWTKMFKNNFKSYQKNTKYWPLRLENHFRKEPLLGRYTTEHIMPKTLTPEWRDAIGSDSKEIHVEYLNRPGNITLTKHNSNLGNLGYLEKYNKSEVGYKYTPLKLNESLQDGEEWNKDTIDERSEKLAELAIECWPNPVEDTG